MDQLKFGHMVIFGHPVFYLFGPMVNFLVLCIQSNDPAQLEYPYKTIQMNSFRFGVTAVNCQTNVIATAVLNFKVARGKNLKEMAGRVCCNFLVL